MTADPFRLRSRYKPRQTELPLGAIPVLQSHGALAAYIVRCVRFILFVRPVDRVHTLTGERFLSRWLRTACNTR
jgi:hypothetical protein